MPRAERRLPTQLLRFWQEACRGRLMPSEGDIDKAALSECWDRCFLLDTASMTYTHLGQRIIDSYDEGGMDEAKALVASPDAARLALSFKQVSESAAPVISEGEFKGEAGRRIRYRQVLLPLGEQGKVSAILGGVNFRAYGP